MDVNGLFFSVDCHPMDPNPYPDGRKWPLPGGRELAPNGRKWHLIGRKLPSSL